MLREPAYLAIEKNSPKVKAEADTYSCKIGNLSTTASDISTAIEHLRAAILTMTKPTANPGFYQTDVMPEISGKTVAIYRLPEGMLHWIATPANDPSACVLVNGKDVLR